MTKTKVDNYEKKKNNEPSCIHMPKDQNPRLWQNPRTRWQAGKLSGHQTRKGKRRTSRIQTNKSSRRKNNYV